MYEPAIVRLFFLSGVSGILFEVLWIRIFTSILGSSTQSVGAVIAAFMLGIAVGQKVFGAMADQPRNLLRLYAALELGVVVFAALAFWLFVGLDGVFRTVHPLLPGAVVKWGVFALAFLLISMPAALIGGSLPVLVKQVLGGGGDTREGIGRLYGANTIGAALGALFAVFLVRAAGYDLGYHLALAVNGATALFALHLSRKPFALSLSKDEPVGPAPKPVPDDDSTVPGALIPIAFAVSGFAALTYEVVWQRLLEFLLQGTLLSFAVILSIYLCGLGLGSVVTRRLGGSGQRLLAQFAWFEAAVATLGLAALPLVAIVAEEGGRPWAIAAFLGLIFVITLLFGAIFPLVGQLYVARTSRLGKASGDLYAANTVGAVLGSLGASFVLIPLVGTKATYLIACGLNLAVAAVLVLRVRGPGRRRSFAALAFAALIFVPWATTDWVHRYYLAAIDRPGFELIAERESSLQPVLVLENDAGLRVLMGGAFQSGEVDEVRRQTQRLQAHLPMLVHPDPKRVLEIGYGVGEIPRTVLLYGPERLDLVEIDPNMIGTANEYFGELNAHASDAPNVRTHLLDGRHFLRVSQEQWDVILTDSMIPVSELSLRMYTRDHFEAGKAHLSPGGVMVMWLPLNVGEQRARVMLRTFLDVFPNSLLWLPQAFSSYEAFVVGFRDEVRLDPAKVRARFEAVAAKDLAPFGWTDPAVFLSSFRGGPAELAQLVEGITTLHRDRAPILDFIPADPEAGAHALVAAIEEVGRPVANGFVKDAALREAVASAFEAQRAYQQSPGEPERALALFDDHPAARLQLAASHREASRFERALQYSPWDVTSHLSLMKRAAARGDRVRAREHAKKALVLQPYSKEARSMLAGGGVP